MNKIKKRSGFLVVILILSITLAACGSIKEDVQGKWEYSQNKDLHLNFKDDNLKLTYTKNEDGVKNTKTMTGKLLDEKEKYIVYEINGIEGKGKIKVKSYVLMLDEKKFKKAE
ncbi:hypothetical protein, partial [Mammaliicoccus sp. E-M21]|uniref:hypothetical protein n=1 Tax=Mammaliicoccus sp. E-M21 TaxID=2898681 RepID=UPI001EFB998F